LGGENRQRFKPFYNFRKQKRNQTDVYLIKIYYVQENNGLRVKIWGRVHRKGGGWESDRQTDKRP
jgi:hypothetical protein